MQAHPWVRDLIGIAYQVGDPPHHDHVIEVDPLVRIEREQLPGQPGDADQPADTLGADADPVGNLAEIAVHGVRQLMEVGYDRVVRGEGFARPYRQRGPQFVVVVAAQDRVGQRARDVPGDVGQHL